MVVTRYHSGGNLSKIAKRLHVKFVGGSLCLDFVNTVGGRDVAGGVIRDKIACYEDLAAWSLPAGSLSRRAVADLLRLAAGNRREAGATLARAVRFREALYRILVRLSRRRRPLEADVAVVRGEVAIARSQQRLSARGAGFAWALQARPARPDHVLWPVALSAGEFLTSAAGERLRQCRGDLCGWFFLDASRNGTRHWCDMRDCGNRAKVKRFRERRGNGG
jgi:predicted RNA-binding Zn ribbon-like protein